MLVYDSSYHALKYARRPRCSLPIEAAITSSTAGGVAGADIRNVSRPPPTSWLVLSATCIVRHTRLLLVIMQVLTHSVGYTLACDLDYLTDKNARQAYLLSSYTATLRFL